MRIEVYPGHPSVSLLGENRRALRHPVAVSAQLRNGRGPKFSCRFLDLSTTGFRAEAVYSLNVGDTVWVTMPGMAGFEAEIAWRDEFTIGARFRCPLHPAVFENLVRMGN